MDAIRWGREPIVLFAVIAAILFGVHALRGRDEGPARIVVTADTVAELAAAWEDIRGRPPGPEELRGEIERWVRDEILVREAVALGLGEDDTVVRERLVRKLERQAAGTEPPAPTDDEVRAFYEANRERWGADGWTPPLEQVRSVVEMELAEERRRAALRPRGVLSFSRRAPARPRYGHICPGERPAGCRLARRRRRRRGWPTGRTRGLRGGTR